MNVPCTFRIFVYLPMVQNDLLYIRSIYNKRSINQEERFNHIMERLRKWVRNDPTAMDISVSKNVQNHRMNNQLHPERKTEGN